MGRDSGGEDIDDGSFGTLGALGSHADESRYPIGHLGLVTPNHPVLPQVLHNGIPIIKRTAGL
jgi:hypothetical protein